MTDLENLRDENSLLIKELDALDVQVERLNYAHNNGAYDPSTTKVLELRENPDLMEHAIRTSTLERLREENAALLGRMSSLEGRKLASGAGEGAQEGMLVPRESYASLQRDYEELQAVIEQKEKMNKRMIDVISLIYSSASTGLTICSCRHGQKKQTSLGKQSFRCSAIDSTFLHQEE